jgi:hypothetical protein
MTSLLSLGDPVGREKRLLQVCGKLGPECRALGKPTALIKGALFYGGRATLGFEIFLLRHLPRCTYADLFKRRIAAELSAAAIGRQRTMGYCIAAIT